MNISYESEALKQLESLPKTVETRVLAKLVFFASQEHSLSFAKYISSAKIYRFRVGDYRILFDIEGDTIIVLAIGKRDDIYRDL